MGLGADAAVVCLRAPPAAPPSLARLETNQATGHAVPRLAQPLARAVEARRTRQGACEREPCCHRSTRREGSGGAYGLPGPQGDAPHRGARHGGMPGVRARSGASRAPGPAPRRCAWPAALAPVCHGACRQRPAGAAPHPRLRLPGQRRRVAPDLGIGREEGTETWLGRSARTDHGLHASPRRRVHRKPCVVPPRTVGAVLRQARQHTRPSADGARTPPAEQKQKIRSQDQCVS